MRTTVDIDAKILDRLRDEAHAQGISFKAMLNRTLRQGLDRPSGDRERYVCPTFDMGSPLRPLDKALALADALEEEEVARRLGQRR